MHYSNASCLLDQCPNCWLRASWTARGGGGGAKRIGDADTKMGSAGNKNFMV